MIDPEAPDFENTPVATRRPERTYLPAGCGSPLVSIITPYYNVSLVFEETVRSVLRQSFVRWEWLIVDDGSTDAASLARLQVAAAADARIRIVHQTNSGPGVARNTAAAQARAPYLFQLDADDLIEPTFLEKALWVLETQPQFAACGAYNVTFGAKPLLWPHGFQEYAESLYDNRMTNQALIRRSAWIKAGGYDPRISYEHADWDFWLNLAEVGLWGYTIQEYLVWYRTQQNSLLREIEGDLERAYAFRAWLADKHRALRSRFPCPIWRRNAASVAESLEAEPPFTNPLAKPIGTRRVLFVVPWLEVGGADRFNLDLVRTLSARGYEFTIVTTALSDDPWTSRFTALTPDVFCLHRFLDVADYLRFITYLVESRQIDAILISNSEFAYRALPYLRARFPQLPLLDFNHLEDEAWLDGGYPGLSVRAQCSLDLQLTCSEQLKHWMVEHGNKPEQIDVQYCRIDASEWSADHYNVNDIRRRYELPLDRPVILFVGRLVAQKRPLLIGHIIRKLMEREPGFVAVVVGSGPEERPLRRLAARYRLGRHLRFLGVCSPAQVRELFAAADLLLLPSASEGLALVLYEAMAMCTVPVAAAVGGHAELVTPECGRLVAQSEHEIEDYVSALAYLLQQTGARTAMAEHGRQRVAVHFDIRELATGMEQAFARAKAHAATRTGTRDAGTRQCVTGEVAASIDMLRRDLLIQMALQQNDGVGLARVARQLRRRYLPLGSQRYERYKRIRRSGERFLHLTVSLPRYIRTGKIKAVPVYVMARILRRPMRSGHVGSDSERSSRVLMASSEPEE